MEKRGRAGLESLAADLAADRVGAFPRLVAALQDGVYSGALRLTGSRPDAEEVVQEAFIRAYRALGRYPAEQVAALHLQEWMWSIAANLCRNQARSRRRRPTGEPPAADLLPDPAPGPEQQAVAASERERLAAHGARLPWAQREAVVLRHVAGLSYAEAAAALGRPAGTVKSDVHRGLQRLRLSLEEEP